MEASISFDMAQSHPPFPVILDIDELKQIFGFRVISSLPLRVYT